MSKLKDLVNVNINRDNIQIQGVNIPVIFTMESFPFIEESYGKSYKKFEEELNSMMGGGSFSLNKKERKLMNVLIYAMVRSGGTETTLDEISGAIPLRDLPAIFETVIKIFSDQNFQLEDMEKIKEEKK